MIYSEIFVVLKVFVMLLEFGKIEKMTEPVNVSWAISPRTLWVHIYIHH